MKENYQIYLPYQPWEMPNFLIENENPVSLEYVKKSKTDFDFFPDNSSRGVLVTDAIRFPYRRTDEPTDLESIRMTHFMYASSKL